MFTNAECVLQKTNEMNFSFNILFFPEGHNNIRLTLQQYKRLRSGLSTRVYRQKPGNIIIVVLMDKYRDVQKKKADHCTS